MDSGLEGVRRGHNAMQSAERVFGKKKEADHSIRCVLFGFDNDLYLQTLMA